MKSWKALVVSGVTGIGLMGAFSGATADGMANNAPESQFFSGSVQMGSADGTIPYGPSYTSLVHRIVDKKNDHITECVSQQGATYVTEIDSTLKPLVFSVRDTTGNFTGTVTYSDQTLSAWSYDISVLKPQPGRITGNLPAMGGRIDAMTGKMSIKKLWNNSVLFSEGYEAVSESRYKAELVNMVGQEKAAEVNRLCR